MSKILGKRLYQIVQKSLDPNQVNRLRRRCEEVKLQIIDAIENGKRPKIYDVDDLYDISGSYQSNGDYNFVFKEFENWLSENGLTYSFNSQRTSTFRDMGDDQYYITNWNMLIRCQGYVNFDEIPDEYTPTLNGVINKKY